MIYSSCVQANRQRSSWSEERIRSRIFVGKDSSALARALPKHFSQTNEASRPRNGNARGSEELFVGAAHVEAVLWLETLEPSQLEQLLHARVFRRSPSLSNGMRFQRCVSHRRTATTYISKSHSRWQGKRRSEVVAHADTFQSSSSLPQASSFSQRRASGNFRCPQ